MLNNHAILKNFFLLELKDVKKYFPIRKGVFGKARGSVKAVDGINFNIKEGETFGLVGESGCGKSTAAKMILLIENPTSGAIYFQGKDIFELANAEKQLYRESIQPVFQDPSGSLSPRLRIGDIISEPIKVRRRFSKKEIKDRITEVLLAVGLRGEHSQLFPHEFSGGQKQRIAIARALSTNPKLILLDEPISSLDVSIRAQVMNLLQDLQKKLGLAYLFIAHDLAVILHMSTNIGVMYAGKIMERAERDEIYQHTAHPYTKALFSAAFQHLKGSKFDEAMLPGEVASPLNPPPGCRFHPRCSYAKSICSEKEPELQMISSGHEVACHLWE